ncbi:MAG: glyoxylate/hydroxypyruvate reductase A [Alphaproteobacteria bacterium]|nr:glyoxylate/hydroxypyruvate reductase A [Alphaproteobacteria bacterium]MDA7986975.1 glyoxylate/hydroxypyruvate reductase A [Alphaproteobacteria bacterium]
MNDTPDSKTDTPDTLLYLADPYSQEAEYGETWREHLSRLAPDIPFRVWPDEVGDGDAAAVRWALVWAPPEGVLAGFPNLELVISMGAGTDHLHGDSAFPSGVKVVRMVEPTLTQKVAEHAVMSVLMAHRELPMYLDQQRRREWVQHENFMVAADRRVGVLGMGPIGMAISEKLRDLGFPVTGWSRTPREIDGVLALQGPVGLDVVFAESDILVLVLPNAPGTRHILDVGRLVQMPRGASVVNVGRGTLIDEPALLSALNCGHIASAVLDVYDEEPLPAESRFWDHPRVIVTPHIAGLTNPRTASEYVVAQVRRHQRGEELLYVAEGF